MERLIKQRPTVEEIPRDSVSAQMMVWGPPMVEAAVRGWAVRGRVPEAAAAVRE